LQEAKRHVEILEFLMEVLSLWRRDKIRKSPGCPEFGS